MSIKKRITFGKFKQHDSEDKPDQQQLPRGFLSRELKQAYCKSMELQSVIDMVDKNTFVHWKTNGDWSMHQLFLSMIDKVGPCDAYVSSYAVSETAARMFSTLKDEGLIKSLSGVFDNRVETRSAGSMQLMKNVCDRYALIPTHAKVTLLVNEKWQLAIVGSANYTENKRWEAGFICSNNDVVQFHLSWILNELP